MSDVGCGRHRCQNGGLATKSATGPIDRQMDEATLRKDARAAEEAEREEEEAEDVAEQPKEHRRGAYFAFELRPPPSRGLTS